MGVAIEFVLLAFLCNWMPTKVAIGTLLVSFFAVGMGNYFIYKRLTQKRVIRIEAERWLSMRERRSPQQRDRIRFQKQIGAWSSIVLVAIVCPFLPEAFGLVTHILYPRSTRLAGYRAIPPLTWMVFDNSLEEGSYTSAFQFAGLFRSGFTRYWHLQPRAAAMSFAVATAREQPFSIDPRGDTLDVRTFRLGGETITCREYFHIFKHFREDTDARAVDCDNSTGTFSASFYGDKDWIPDFYRTVENVRPTNGR